MEYYYVCAEAKAHEVKFATPREAFFGSHLRWKFLLEFLVHIVQPWPYCPVELEIPAVWIAFMRVYLVLRAMRDCSNIYIYRHQLREERRTDIPLKGKVGLLAAFRVMFWEHPAIFLMGALFFFGFIFTYIVYASERDMWIPIPVDNDLQRLEPVDGRTYLDLDPLYQSQYKKTLFNSVANCIWFIAVTGTTTGYGDMLPVTKAGRIIAMITAIYGIMLASFSVGIITQILSPSAFEAHLLAYSKTNHLSSLRKNAAANVIKATWLLYRYRRRKLHMMPKRSILNAASQYFKKGPSQLFQSYKTVETKKSLSTLTPEKSSLWPQPPVPGAGPSEESFLINRRESFFHHTPAASAEETRLFAHWCHCRSHFLKVQDRVSEYRYEADQRNIHKHAKALQKQVSTLEHRVESLEKDLKAGQFEILKLLRSRTVLSSGQTSAGQRTRMTTSLEASLLEQSES